MDRQAMGVGVGGAAVVGVAFGMARYAYGLTLPDVRSEFGLSEVLHAVTSPTPPVSRSTAHDVSL